MKRLIVFAVLIGAAGCASIPNPFVHLKPNYAELPAEVLLEVAREIEDAVQEGNREPAIAGREGVVVDDEIVVHAIRTRAARFEVLTTLLDSGHARELRKGLVEILASKEYRNSATRRERNRNAMIVMNENQSRWDIYEGILRSSRFPRRSLSAIQDTFHKARLECMSSGQKYEDASGETVTKGR